MEKNLTEKLSKEISLYEWNICFLKEQILGKEANGVAKNEVYSIYFMSN